MAGTLTTVFLEMPGIC